MNQQSVQYDLIVIGGGASGLMAAGVAAAAGRRVLVLEKNAALGEKLKITGGGRCNITNATFDHHDMLAHYGDAAKFLFSSFSQFDVQSTFDFFESRGLPLKIEDRNRAFPQTERASDVLKVLEREMQQYGVEVRTNARVTRIHTQGGHITSVQTTSGTFAAESVVLATGGLSHAETGSTGDGFAWLKELGHTIIEPSPTIVPVATQERWSHALAGTTVKDAKMAVYSDSQKQFTKTGSILFTHFGLSGPTVLNSAKQVKDLLEEGDVTVQIDLFPTQDEGMLDAQLIALFETNQNKLLKNVLSFFVPSSMTSSIIQQVSQQLQIERGVLAETPVHSVTREQRRAIVKWVKTITLTVTHLMGFDRAVVADGGVPLTEIEMKTMRSKKIQNLFITGDLLHINRPSGGFSLQLCWTTGYVAGQHV